MSQLIVEKVDSFTVVKQSYYSARNEKEMYKEVASFDNETNEGYITLISGNEKQYKRLNSWKKAVEQRFKDESIAW